MVHHRENLLRQRRGKMAFVCQMCGDCCSTMGEIISILEQTGTTTFRIGYSATLEERVVTLDPDKQDLFFATSPKTSLACPFLRERAPGRFICTVHQSRPELCRQYSCFRILVLDPAGHHVGRVREGSRHFTTTDPRLHAVWQTGCRLTDIQDEDVWEKNAEEIFTRSGYRVIR
jgi:Fe-S-cluster containining protein